MFDVNSLRRLKRIFPSSVRIRRATSNSETATDIAAVAWQNFVSILIKQTDVLPQDLVKARSRDFRIKTFSIALLF